jgi:hypothetical protein
MTAHGRAWVRRTTTLAAAGITLATGATGALAAPRADAPGSGFGPINITAMSSAVRAPLFSNGGEEVIGNAPYSEVVMSAGLSGHALTSVFWPGGTAGAGGSTLYTATNGCIPPAGPCAITLPESSFEQLNDPMKAQAQTGAGKPVDKNDQNGITQEAVAKPATMTATSTITASKVPQVSEAFGKTTATSAIKIRGPKTALVTASSTLRDVSLAGGLVKISSISSTATATSNTVTGTGKAATTVSGATIAGIPVTIDSNGIEVKGKGSKRPALTDQVNKALKQSGISIYVAQPTKTISGPNVTVDAGNLIVLFQQSQYVAQANDTGALLQLGGASISANTGKGFRLKTFPTNPTTPIGPSGGTTTGGSAPAGNGAGTAAGGGIGGGAGNVPAGGSTNTGGSSAGQQPHVAPAPALAASAAHLLTGYGIVWVVLGALLAAGLAFGLRRLPDRLLQTPTVTCPLED